MSTATDALTSLGHGAGCGCKLPAAALLPIVRDLGAPGDERLLVGSATADDAAVFRLTNELALVQTIDFFTPVVDDPYDFGRIAAANALSDVYAMGARPLIALNVVAFPLERLGEDVLREILRGGLDVVTAAGAIVAGGHSIDDPEPKYGLAVTGTVHRREVLTNAGALPGDVLVLTKPLGEGAIVTACKHGVTGDEELLSRAVAVMVELNASAAVAAHQAQAHAVTDVTGFGLRGHLHRRPRRGGGAAAPAVRRHHLGRVAGRRRRRPRRADPRAGGGAGDGGRARHNPRAVNDYVERPGPGGPPGLQDRGERGRPRWMVRLLRRSI